MKLSAVFSSPTILLGLLASAKAFPYNPRGLNTTAVGDEEDGFPVITEIPPVGSAVDSNNEVMVRRGPDALIKSHKCSVGRPPVHIGNAQQVVDFYRKDVQGQCSLEGKSCKMLTCIGKTGVYWCNENDWLITRDCKEFGDHLQHIIDNCAQRPSHPAHKWVHGLVEDRDGYTIELAAAKGKTELSQCSGKSRGW